MNETNNYEKILREKSIALAEHIAVFSQQLEEIKNETLLSKQLFRSGTAIEVNIREAFNADTKRDLVNKLTVARRECDESLNWLALLKSTGYITEKEMEPLSTDCIELMKVILITIIAS